MGRFFSLLNPINPSRFLIINRLNRESDNGTDNNTTKSHALIALTLIAVIGTGCGKDESPFKSLASYSFCPASSSKLTRSPASTNKAQTIPVTALKHPAKKVFINQSAESTNPDSVGLNLFFNKSQSQTVKKGTKLVGVYDNQCLRRKKAKSSVYSTQIFSQQKQRFQAYPVSLKESVSLSNLESQAQSDDCLAHLVNDMTFSINVKPNDPSYSRQRHHTAIRSESGWDGFYGAISPDEEVLIAIIDTGVDYNHPDLRDQMWKDAQGNYGRDFINNDNDPMDGHKHGTHVAGLAAARSDNSVGIAGVMGKNIKIMAVKVLSDRGSGNLQASTNGIYYAADNGADVINMSLGGPGLNQAVKQALEYAVSKGSTVIVAAGNDTANLDNTSYTPASYGAQIEGMLTIGSTDAATKAVSSFSNFHPDHVELGSPGSNGLYSTTPNGSYEDLQGTSMASPVAAGAASLVVAALRSAGEIVTPTLVEEIFRDGSPQLDPLRQYFTQGRHLDLVQLYETTMGHTDISSPVILNQSRTLMVNEGEKVAIEIQVESPITPKVAWTKNSRLLDEFTKPNIDIDSVRPKDAGFYQAKVRNPAGEAETDEIGLIVFGKDGEIYCP